MRHSTWMMPAFAAVVLLASIPSPARAQDSSSDPVQVRDRIERGVRDGLARDRGRDYGYRGASVTSHPAALAKKPAAHAAKPAAAPAAPVAPAVRDTTPDGIWNDMLAGNQRFVAGRPQSRTLVEERAGLVQDQHPRAIVLGCADSRVGPEFVFDQTLGDLFVVRTAGNIVDPIALGSIEYAAEHLHAPLLVVLGHGGCGAVKAAAADGDMPSAYLQAIVDRIRPTVQRLSNCFEGDELVERSVIANARQSAQDILANSKLLREEVATGRLKVVSAFYDLKTGVVTSVSAPNATAQATTAIH